MELDMDTFEVRGMAPEYYESKTAGKLPEKKSKATKINSGASHRRYAITSFNHLDFSHYDGIYDEHKQRIIYMIVGKEICPDTNREHIQGYVHFKTPTRFSTVKTYFKDNTLHIEPCKGNHEDNVTYCSKDGNYKEYGSVPAQGKRNDITKALSQNKNLNQFIKNNPDIYIRYRSGIEGYYRAQGTDYNPLDDKPLVLWLYGDTGVGKSRAVRDYIKQKITDGYRVWRRPLGVNYWFDGYSDQDIVFLDEVRGSTYKFDDLLQLLDYDSPQVPVKGGFVDFKPKVILITSNTHPRHVYDNLNDENKQQLVRRCDKIFHIKKFKERLLLE